METHVASRKPDPSDVSDEEWAFVAPYLALVTPDAPQRRYDLRAVFNATRWIVRAGAPWRMLPTNFPPANAQDREQVAQLTEAVQDATGQTVEVAYVDQGDTGVAARDAAAQRGLDLVVVKLDQANRGFVLLPRRWVVARSFAWATRFRRLAKDYERLPEVVEGRCFLAFVSLMLKQFVLVAAQSP